MIFEGSQTYESHRQRHITEQEVNAIHTLAAPTQLWWSQMAITFDQGDVSYQSTVMMNLEWIVVS
jgi:hypothetical protein